MTKEQFNDLVDETLRKAHDILTLKNPEYTNLSADVLNNFKELARLAETTPLQVWSVFFLKHVLSIMAYTRRGNEAEVSEPIEGRAVDLINYMLFFVALVKEKR